MTNQTFIDWLGSLIIQYLSLDVYFCFQKCHLKQCTKLPISLKGNNHHKKHMTCIYHAACTNWHTRIIHQFDFVSNTTDEDKFSEMCNLSSLFVEEVALNLIQSQEEEEKTFQLFKTTYQQSYKNQYYRNCFKTLHTEFEVPQKISSGDVVD